MTDSPGFLFLRYRDIETVRVLRPVPASEMKKLEARRKDWQNAAGVMLPIQRAAEPNPEVFAPPTFANQPRPGVANLSEEQMALLDQFPPVGGWTPERYKTLQKDVVLAGREMTVSEDKWTRVYPEWLAAYRVFTGSPLPAGSAKSAPVSRAASSRPSVTPHLPSRKPAPKPRRRVSSSKPGQGDATKIDVNDLAGSLGGTDSRKKSSSRPSGGLSGAQRGRR